MVLLVFFPRMQHHLSLTDSLHDLPRFLKFKEIVKRIYSSEDINCYKFVILLTTIVLCTDNSTCITKSQYLDKFFQDNSTCCLWVSQIFMCVLFL